MTSKVKWSKKHHRFHTFSYTRLIDKSHKKTVHFAKMVTVTHTTYIIDDFELKRSSIKVKKLTYVLRWKGTDN